MHKPAKKSMKQSLRFFLKEIVDYAGLFPPADLSLDTALHNYSDYRSSSDSWMLSRFVIPAGRLKEVHSYSQSLFSTDDPLAFSVLGKKTETLDEYEYCFQKLVSQIDDFHNRQDNRVTTDILEVNIPAEALFANDYSMLNVVFERTAETLSESEHTPQYVFYEAVMEENWKKDIKHVLETLSEHYKKKVKGDYRYAGIKLRCGGTEANIFPSVEQVAFILNKARDRNIAVKCTAGLHHPIRHYNDSVQTKMHGFLNVFGGAMLSYAHDLTDEELIEILRDEDYDHFTFTEEAFKWRDLAVFTGEIRELREVALISFGSCSFDEPREDLQKMGFL